MAMVFARTAAMTFNRVVDWEFDKRNPRTADRHLLVSRQVAITVCAISSLLFIMITLAMNQLCLILAPLALGIIFFYSLTKRFTYASQFFLGLASSVAPVGAWSAVTGAFSLSSFILALCVFLWVAGFDTIYAIQDVASDRREGLKSIAVLLGESTSLQVARWLHMGMFFSMVLFGWMEQFGIYYAIVLGVILCVIGRYYFIYAKRLKPVNWALNNAVIGVLFAVGTVMEVVYH